nr:reverse transcriptase domain-containing protein [Tanacetum cinerariifolium]
MGFTPSHKVEFHIDLIPRAMPIEKSPYHLAPTERQELSNQLKELKDIEMLQGLGKKYERKEDGRLYFVEQIMVPVYGNLRTLIMDEAYATKYFVHPRANKMYYNLRDLYWWPGMKKDIASYTISGPIILLSPTSTQAMRVRHFLPYKTSNGAHFMLEW